MVTHNHLTEDQIASYLDNGYLYLPKVVSEDELAPVRKGIDALIEDSRALQHSNTAFALEDGHSAATPRLRRIAFIDELHDAFWPFAQHSKVVDIVSELFGPDIRFRDMKVNFKWEGGGSEIGWHQDSAYFPHTNHSTCQALLQLSDVGAHDGPVRVISGSHRAGVLNHYDEHDKWTGVLRPEDLERLGTHNTKTLTGPTGSLVILHGAVVHGSASTTVPRRRSLMVIGYGAGDALPITPPLYPGAHYGNMVRGAPPRYARFEPMTVRLPPAWQANSVERLKVRAGG